MKYNVFGKTIMGAVAIAVAGIALSSCDDDKIFTTDYTEAYPLTQINFAVSEKLPLAVGMDSVINFTVGPDNADNKTIVFKSSDPSVATVDQEGRITAVAIGTAVISAVPELGFGADAAVEVNVIPELIKAREVILSLPADLGPEGKLYETDEVKLDIDILPADHTYDYVLWSSSDTSLATVDENGVVKCLAPGKVSITAMTTDRSGVKGSINLDINKYIAAESLQIEPYAEPVSLPAKDISLSVAYTPMNATLGSVEWSSSNELVATVKRGVVSPIGFGTTTITAKCPATGFTASTEITVTPGWYVWDSSNAWDRWIVATGGASENRGDVWRVFFPQTAAGKKWRADIKVNCGNNNMLTTHSDYPVFALKCTIPKGGNNTWDVRDSGSPKDNAGYDLPDGTRLIMIDMSKKFKEVWGEGYHDFNLFQLKVADIPYDNVNPQEAWYDIYWIRSFRSADEARAFAENECKK